MDEQRKTGQAAANEAASVGWLNRNVVGAGLTSLLADACYETATSVMPAFLATLGMPAGDSAAFGAIALKVGLTEGTADAVSSSVKLGTGWWGDRFGHRKAIVVAGYALTAVATGCFALAVAWPMVLIGRVAAWFGKGIRGPLRNAILAESVPAADRGKVFGFHRAGDTLGAILGPLLGAWLLGLLEPQAAADATGPLRTIFLLTLIPGLGSALVFALLVRERRRAPNPAFRLGTSLRSLPGGFRRFLIGVGFFGAGDFAHTLLILAATERLTPQHGFARAAQIAALLYAVRNTAHAATAFPVGALADRWGRRGLLAGGYLLGSVVMAGFALAFAAPGVSLLLLGVLFALAGVYVAIEEALEPALTADLVHDEGVRGTAYGVLGTVNGVGDFISSAAVGLLWYWSGPAPGLALTAALMLVGTLLLHRVR